MLDPRFTLLGGALGLIGTGVYAYRTLQGRTQPNRVSWLLWALAPFVTLAAQISQGIGWQAVISFTAGFGPFMIFVASLVNQRSYWKISRLDIACAALSVFALVLWGLTRTGLVAIALSIAADALAGVPTIVKAYRAPRTENPTPFIFGTINATIVLLTVDQWRFEVFGFALYILIICLLLVILIKFPHFRFRPNLDRS
jgi:hypothetical protein